MIIMSDDTHNHDRLSWVYGDGYRVRRCPFNARTRDAGGMVSFVFKCGWFQWEAIK